MGLRNSVTNVGFLWSSFAKNFLYGHSKELVNASKKLPMPLL